MTYWHFEWKSFIRDSWNCANPNSYFFILLMCLKFVKVKDFAMPSTRLDSKPLRFVLIDWLILWQMSFCGFTLLSLSTFRLSLPLRKASLGYTSWSTVVQMAINGKSGLKINLSYHFRFPSLKTCIVYGIKKDLGDFIAIYSGLEFPSYLLHYWKPDRS